MSAENTVVVAVIARNGRVLLVHRRDADESLSWQFPAAVVQYGESIEEAAVREAMDETGVKCAAGYVQGGRVDPLTGQRMIYLLCDFIGEAGHAADEATVDVAWAAENDLHAYASSSVQTYIDILARQRRHADLAVRSAWPH